MLSKRLAASWLTNILWTIGFLGIVSCFSFLWRDAFAQEAECEMKSIKSGNGVDAIELNFTRLTGCIKKLQAKLDQSSVPDGAVLAFDTDKCPDGWEYYLPTVGRFILGGLPPPSNPVRVLPYPKAPIMSIKGSVGGVNFAPTYFPPMSITQEQWNQKTVFGVAGLPGLYPDNQQQTLAAYQGADAEPKPGQKIPTYNFVPPYVALLYCKKMPPPLAPANR
jgi:hypothetical protein